MLNEKTITLASLISRSATISKVSPNSQARELSENLEDSLKQIDLASRETRPFVERLVRTFSECGSVEGAGIRAFADSPLQVKSQVRRVFEKELQPRSQPDASLLILIGKTIVDGTITEMFTEKPDQREAIKRVANLAQRILEYCDVEIGRLAQDPAWQTLTSLSSRNHISLLHYYTWGFPAYAQLGFMMHKGLCARIAQVRGLSSAKQKKALGAYLTVAKAFIPILSKDLVDATLRAQDDWELGEVIRRAAERLHGIQASTRQQYTNVFVHMLTQKAACNPFIAKRRGYQFAAAIREDGDPDDVIEQRLDLRNWVMANLANAARSDPAPLLEELDGLSETDVIELAGLRADQVFDRSRYIRDRLVMERNVQVYSPGVASIGELASCYAAPLWKDESQDWVSGFNRMSRFVFFDTLLHTGRAPEWLASLNIETDGFELDDRVVKEPRTHPLFSAEDGCIYYPRPSELYLPRALQPPNTTTGKAFSSWQAKCQEHNARYRRFELLHEIPLSPHQLKLYEKYERLCGQAKQRLGHERLSRFQPEPFFLIADAQGLRAWQKSDTQHLFLQLSEWIKRLHPGWASVHPSHLAKTFRAYYVSQFGLDPIYAGYVSGNIPAELEQPIHYALIDLKQLQRHYGAAQEKFGQCLLDEYRQIWQSYTHIELPWVNLDPIRPKHRKENAFGSWRCPRREHLMWIIAQLIRMTQDPEKHSAHNACVTLLAVMLQLTLGLRPYEVTHLTKQVVDLYARTIVVVGKFNYAYESYRQMPIPGELVLLVRWMLNIALESETQKLNTPFLQIYHNNAYKPAQLMDLQLIWEQAAIASGKLRSEQIPELGSLRHFYRTVALMKGYPHTAVNALMGHQSGGRELFHPYLNQDTRQVFHVGLQLASEMASVVCFESKHIHYPE